MLECCNGNGQSNMPKVTLKKCGVNVGIAIE